MRVHVCEVVPVGVQQVVRARARSCVCVCARARSCVPACLRVHVCGGNVSLGHHMSMTFGDVCVCVSVCLCACVSVCVCVCVFRDHND